VLAKNSSYGAPILSFFTGVGAQNADTRAGEAYPVTINGFNMVRVQLAASQQYTRCLSAVQFIIRALLLLLVAGR